MQVGDTAAQAGYDLHVTGKSVSINLQINEKYMQQFVDNQKRLASDTPLPSDPMKHVDNSLVASALNDG